MVGNDERKSGIYSVSIPGANERAFATAKFTEYVLGVWNSRLKHAEQNTTTKTAQSGVV